MLPRRLWRGVKLMALTKAAYLQAKSQRPATHERRTFPLKKSSGKIVVPTTAGNKVFKDRKVSPETQNASYDYLGYFPRVQEHLLKTSHWEAEEVLLEEVLTVRSDGRILRFLSEPVYSPGKKYLVVALHISFEGAENGLLQVFEQQSDTVKLLWEATPEDWDAAEVFWATDNTIFVKQRRCKNGVPYKPARFTYAQLLMR